MNFRQREAERMWTRRDQLFTQAAAASLADHMHLGEAFATENLFPAYRDEMLSFFRDRNIHWHGDWQCDSSIASSQAAALNLWFPFAREPQKLKTFLEGAFADVGVEGVLPIIGDVAWTDGRPHYVTFEWIGLNEYLGEPGRRVRGQHVTNAGVVVRFRQNDGRIHLVLIESKYAEAYPETPPRAMSQRGTNRVRIYEPFLGREDAPMRRVEPLERLFYDPIEQLMRLQLLAMEMERAKEMEADVVSVLLLFPSANTEFTSSVPSSLAEYGASVPEVWQALAKEGRFRFVHLETMLDLLITAAPDQQWLSWMQNRYGKQIDP